MNNFVNNHMHDLELQINIYIKLLPTTIHKTQRGHLKPCLLSNL